jgi:UDP-N-acetylglucosamine diphosphorylase / glucose-1-phosphate thymidylyltransferase / UDP-N-acetylgalactosamine diphosphorylase / glucosamine-1-phosphate N-acetyltransferase / galactosamine-1-phosphate N-acetyltransferase
MKAVIFAAGEGKRMRPLTETTPKPMLQVLGKPLLQYTFEALPDSVDEVVIVVGYKRDHIQNALGSKYLGKHVTYVVQERPGGTGAALMLARDALGTGQFLKFYGDDIYQKSDVERLFEHHYSILVSEVDNPSAFGVVELAPDRRIESFEEKPEHPKSNLVSAGVMLLDERIFEYADYALPNPKTGERYDVDMVMALAKDHAVYGVPTTRWLQIGYPEDLARAEFVLKQS